MEASYLSPAGSTELGSEVIAGLTSQPRWISSKWLYDEYGSKLFERITRLPEYYLTRAEDEILARRAASIAEFSRANAVVELGAGSTARVMPVLKALAASECLRSYIPVDIAEKAVQITAAKIGRIIPAANVEPITADFQRPLHERRVLGRHMIVFLGSTIGNLTSSERAVLLGNIRNYLHDGEAFLLGVDLVKQTDMLLRAYSDDRGLTAEFNANILRALNDAYEGDFDVSKFEHIAVWNASDEHIEMRLKSLLRQTVKLCALDLSVDLALGEEIRTEISSKFRRAGIEAALGAAHMRPIAWWTDLGGNFAVSLSVAM